MPVLISGPEHPRLSHCAPCQGREANVHRSNPRCRHRIFLLEQILRAALVLRFVVLERDKAWFYALWNLPGRIDPIEARGRKQQREYRTMSSIGLGARSPIIGAHADHRTTDFFFARTQSLQMRDLPWERRMKPLLSVQRAALQVFVVLTLAIVTFSIV